MRKSRTVNPDHARRGTPPTYISSPITTLAQSETFPPVSRPNTPTPAPDTKRPTPDTPVMSTKPPSTRPKHDVFISHAGEDKATIAFPLRKMLMKHGITTFVDEKDIEPGSDAEQTMIHAMETAKVAVIVLSPELVARKWPIKELMCFMRRVEESAADDRNAPVIIPMFYRLTIDDLYFEPRLDRRDKDGTRLYEKSRFFERMKNREPEADISTIERLLQQLHKFMGVRNDFDASNGSSPLMSKRREKLLDELCNKVKRAIPAKPQNIVRYMGESVRDRQSQGSVDVFRRFFPTLSRQVQAVLNFENRKTSEGYVKQLLLDETSISPSVFSVHGMGGVGKSTIMRALSTDDDIRQRFPDGIHLMKLGQDATPKALLLHICQVLEDSGAHKTSHDSRVKDNIDEALLFFERWFDGKRCAFFIDDAWEHGIDLSLLSRLCKIGNGLSGNSVLMTTREHGIASLAPSEKIVHMVPREARGRVSRKILFFHADFEEMNCSTAAVDTCVNKILDICAGLPASLAVAGKTVKKMCVSVLNDKEGAWNQYLSHLLISRDRLFRTDVATSWGKYQNLFATISSSISCLDEKSREETLGFESFLSFAEMYRRMCVLQKQAVVPSSMLKHLWQAQSTEHADKIATTFVEMGLASRETARFHGESMWYLSLHDSLQEFAVADAKRNGTTKESHERLLSGYKSFDTDMSYSVNETPNWWSRKLKADGYIHRNLCRHLLGAGRAAELIELLTCPQWAKRQVLVNHVAFLEADLVLGVQVIQDYMRGASDHGEARMLLELISQAVALSSGFIRCNVPELCFQVHGRLIGSRESCTAIEKYVRWMETDAERPKILCQNSFLVEPGGMNTRIIPVGVYVKCIAVMKGGERIAFGSVYGRIFVVDARLWVVEKYWESHVDVLNALAFSDDGTRIVSGSDDMTAKVWDVHTGGCATTFTGHSNSVSGVAVMGDGKRVISVSYDGSALMWNIETGQIVATLFTGLEAIRCVSILGDGEVAVMGGDDKKLRMWNLAANEQVGETFDGHEQSVSSVAVTPDGKRIVSGSWDNTVKVWDVGSHREIGSFFTGYFSSVECVAVSEDGLRIASSSDEKAIRAWDLESGTQICDTLEGHTFHVTGVLFLADGDLIVSCSLDGTVRVWDVTREKKKHLTSRHKHCVSGVSFTPDARFVVSSSWDKTLRVWNAASGQQVGDPLRGHSDYVTDVAVTPDGRFILSVSWDMTLRMWDFHSRQLLFTFIGHSDLIGSVAVTPQGDRAVTASRDKTVRIWDLAAMDCSHYVLEGHHDPVNRVFVSDDGTRIISVDRKHNIFVWELETKELYFQFRKENAANLSRREVLNFVGETTVHDNTSLSIPLWGRETFYGEGPDATVLATMEVDIRSWALSPCCKYRVNHTQVLE